MFRENLSQHNICHCCHIWMRHVCVKGVAHCFTLSSQNQCIKVNAFINNS
nr:MAG TPA: hypothetical protein [Caudoviricetes sp.]